MIAHHVSEISQADLDSVDGEVENKGLELSLNTKNLTGDFKWNSNFNISFNKNEVIALIIGHFPLAQFALFQPFQFLHQLAQFFSTGTQPKVFAIGSGGHLL